MKIGTKTSLAKTSAFNYRGSSSASSSSVLFLQLLIILHMARVSRSSVPLEGWRFPCTDGRNETVILAEEFHGQAKIFEEEAKRDFLVHKAYEDLIKMVVGLKKRIRTLTNDYFSERFPGEDQDTYKDLTIDIIPKKFGKDSLEASPQKDIELLEEAYENFARFSIYLYFAVAGEKKELFMERKFDDDYDGLYNDPDKGVGSVMCRLQHLLLFFGGAEDGHHALASSLEEMKVDSMPRYLEAKPSGRHIKDFLVVRQFAENLDGIRRHFVLRAATTAAHEDEGRATAAAASAAVASAATAAERKEEARPDFDPGIKERAERHAVSEKVKDAREAEEDEERAAAAASIQMESLEKILKSKRERQPAKPRRKNGGRPSRRIQREHHKEYDVLMQLV